MAQENGRINKQHKTMHKDSTTHTMNQQITIKLQTNKILRTCKKLKETINLTRKQ